MAVGARIGLGDGERHRDRAVGDPGIQRFFCSSVPNLLMMVPLMAGETTIISSGQPPADISSITIESSYMPAPPPPYSSGRLTPMKPSLPASAHNSSVCAPARAFSR